MQVGFNLNGAWFTEVVLEKGPLNGCLPVSLSVSLSVCLSRGKRI